MARSLRYLPDTKVTKNYSCKKLDRLAKKVGNIKI